MPGLLIEQELMMARAINGILPAHSDQELTIRKQYLNNLIEQIRLLKEPVEQTDTTPRPMIDTVKMGMLAGIVEVTQGPPVDHQIGKRRAGFRNVEQPAATTEEK